MKCFGEMEPNSGSDTADNVCSIHAARKPCERAKASKCDWLRTEMKCIMEPDDEEMVPNSGSVADVEGCASLYKKKAKCQKNAACTWKRSKTRKERCTPSIV